MPMKFARKVLLAKKETTYGTDATPNATNAMLVRNLTVRDLALAYQELDDVRPYYANNGEIITAAWSEVSFDVALAGSGTAGTAPKWGVLLQGCGMAETVNAGVSVQYDPVSTGEDSLTLYFQVDGRQHKIQGWRGSFALRFARNAVPLLQVRGLGLHVAATDTALAAPTFTGWQTPLAVNKSNTTTFTLHGFAAAVSEFTYDHANQVPFRDLPNSQSVVITGRKPVGRITMEDVLVATKDWQTIIKSHTTGALAIVHGPAANQIKIDAPAVQLTQPELANEDGILMRTAALDFLPVSGNDEVRITVL